MSSSSNRLMKAMVQDFGQQEAPSPNKPVKLSSNSSKLKEDSISKQFTQSLRKLNAILDSTSPHCNHPVLFPFLVLIFELDVRCVKPNDVKLPGKFMAQNALLQLQYAGMLEAIRIRRQGFALRMPHRDFFVRYSRIEPSCATLVELVGSLSKSLGVGAEAWQVGTTKIFLRKEMSDKLERVLYVRLSGCCRIIQKFWRHMIARSLALKVQTKWRGRKERKAFNRLRTSVLITQSLIRRLLSARRYIKARKSAMRIQAVIRGKLARTNYRRLRNPYNNMDYFQLTELIQENNKKLQEFMVRGFSLSFLTN